MTDTAVAGLVDIDGLTRWMDEVGIEPSAPLEVRRVTTGHSNELFDVRRGSKRFALRRPPETPISETAHNMAREFRLLEAIAASAPAVPIPTPRHLCEDGGVIGAPFFLMDFVDGVAIRHEVPAALDEPGAGTDLAFHLVDSLAEVHLVPWREAGLDGFGRPDGFLTRQVTRWSGQLATYRVRPLPVLDEVGGWLEAHLPPTREPGLVHGDYTMVNVLYEAAPPVRIAAVLDWEMATIGDPLLDLGWLLGLWVEPGEQPLTGAEPAVMGFPERDDMPARSDLANRYATRSDRDLTHLDWYCAMGLFKLCCVMEGSYARYVAGTSDDEMFASLEESIPEMAERAASFT